MQGHLIGRHLAHHVYGSMSAAKAPTYQSNSIHIRKKCSSCTRPQANSFGVMPSAFWSSLHSFKDSENVAQAWWATARHFLNSEQ